MKTIFTLLMVMLLSTNIVKAEGKETLADLIGTECIDEHKISPSALGCAVKKMFRKKDGSPNALRKFYNTKTLKDLKFK